MTTTFCTAINCIDGRTQLPLIKWLSKTWDIEYVDLVTEAGAVSVLALAPESSEAESIYRRVEVSIRAHDSQGIAIVAHHDCAGNPVPDGEQIAQLKSCLDTLTKRYPDLKTMALWVDETWKVHEIEGRSTVDRR